MFEASLLGNNKFRNTFRHLAKSFWLGRVSLVIPMCSENHFNQNVFLGRSKKLYFFWILVKTFWDLVDNFWPSCQGLILCVQRVFLGKIFLEVFKRNYLVLEFLRIFLGFLADKFKQGCRSCILRVQRELWRIKSFLKKKFENIGTFDHKTSAKSVESAFYLFRETFSIKS